MRREGLAATVVLTAALLVGSAHAGPAQTSSLTARELAMREAETATLGASHAAEHAAMRAAALVR